VLPRVKPTGRGEIQTGDTRWGRPQDDTEACHPWCDTRVALSGRMATGREHGRHASAARQHHAPWPSLRQDNALLPLSRHPLSSASLDLSLEACSDDRGTVRDKPALRGLSRELVCCGSSWTHSRRPVGRRLPPCTPLAPPKTRHTSGAETGDRLVGGQDRRPQGLHRLVDGLPRHPRAPTQGEVLEARPMPRLVSGCQRGRKNREVPGLPPAGQEASWSAAAREGSTPGGA